MHVRTKKIALTGLLAAFSAVLMLLGSVIEVSSLFFICAASFVVGVAVREWGMGGGALFAFVSTLINFFVTPNKMYCVTYAAMAVYLLAAQWLFTITGKSRVVHKKLALWLMKYAVFNVMYVPAVIFLQKLLFGRKLSTALFIAVLAAGEIALFVYDEAYRYFQRVIWGKLRVKILREGRQDEEFNIRGTGEDHPKQKRDDDKDAGRARRKENGTADVKAEYDSAP